MEVAKSDSLGNKRGDFVTNPPKKSLLHEIWKYRFVYTLILPGLIWYIIFAYGPLTGLQLAFKTFKSSLGIWGSSWVGILNFKRIFADPFFMASVWKTLQISLYSLIFTFPIPVFLALVLNEIKFLRYKKTIQTILTLPHFLSWVIVAGVLINILRVDGLVNGFLAAIGADKISFLSVPSLFMPMLFVTSTWKESGWGTIIYLAALASIEQEQYEAAEIDGAGRLQKIFMISIPSILPVVVIMLILSIGGLMEGRFDQIFNLRNPAVQKVTETIDIYIYRISFEQPTDFSFSMAVSLFRSVINLILLLIADRSAKLMGSDGLLPSSRSGESK